MNNITVSLNVSDFMAFAFVGFLTILGVKLVLAISALILLPGRGGQNLLAAAGLLLSLATRWYLSLALAIIVALIVCLSGGPLIVVMLICTFATIIAAAA